LGREKVRRGSKREDEPTIFLPKAGVQSGGEGGEGWRTLHEKELRGGRRGGQNPKDRSGIRNKHRKSLNQFVVEKTWSEQSVRCDESQERKERKKKEKEGCP